MFDYKPQNIVVYAYIDCYASKDWTDILYLYRIPTRNIKLTKIMYL